MQTTPENDASGDDHYAELTKFFEERGHTPEEVVKIIGKVRLYDKETVHDSIMGSIAEGRFSIDDFVREALLEE